MTPAITGSALPRVEACPASAVLTPRAEVDTIQATGGSATHAVLERAANGVADPLADCPEEHRESSALALEFVRERVPDLRAGAAEVAFAVRVDRIEARELGRGIDRDYRDVADNEVPLTIDWAALVANATDGALVLDYKTGYRSVGRAADNMQLLIGGVAACATWGRDSATLGIVHIPDGGEAWIDIAKVGVGELVAAHRRLRRIVARAREAGEALAAGRTPDVHMGAWCRYCPARMACPARVAMVRSFAETEAVAPIDRLRAMTAVELRDFHLRLCMAEGAVAGYREALKTIAAEQSIDLGDGHMYGEHPGRRSLRLDVVKKVVAKLAPGGVEAAVDVVEKTSLAAVKRAAARHLGPAARAREIGKFTKELVAEIGRLGGVYQPVSVGEYKADDIDDTDMPRGEIAPPPDDSDIPFG